MNRIEKLLNSPKFVVPAIIVFGLAAYQYRATEKAVAEKAEQKITVRRDEHSVSEIGYVYDMRVTTDWFHRTRSVIWWVKIPSTNRLWSCSLDSGFNNFKRQDPVTLVREDNPEGDGTDDYYGYIVGLHNEMKGRTALVWAIDNDALISDLGDSD